MSDLVSIIIPIYNCKDHLFECISSAVNQSYSNCEIILVDDGSTDNSGCICDDFAEKYDNVFVFHNKNCGVSAARNFGIEKSNGGYIVFLDSDDKLEDCAIELLYNQIKTANARFAIGSFVLFGDKIENSKIDYLRDFPSCISINEYLKRMLRYHVEAYWGANWGKMFLKDIIVSNGIKFESNVQLAEDFRFNLEYLKYVDRVSVVHDTVCYYRVDTKNSLSKGKRNAKRYIEEYLELYRRYFQLFSYKGIFTENKVKIHCFLLNAFQSIVRNLINYGYSYFEVKKSISYISKCDEFIKTEEIIDCIADDDKKKYYLIKNNISLFYYYYIKLLNLRLRIIKKFR